jgi:hypothetical protein
MVRLSFNGYLPRLRPIGIVKDHVIDQPLNIGFSWTRPPIICRFNFKHDFDFDFHNFKSSFLSMSPWLLNGGRQGEGLPPSKTLKMTASVIFRVLVLI